MKVVIPAAVSLKSGVSPMVVSVDAGKALLRFTGFDLSVDVVDAEGQDALIGKNVNIAEDGTLTLVVKPQATATKSARSGSSMTDKSKLMRV